MTLNPTPSSPPMPPRRLTAQDCGILAAVLFLGFASGLPLALTGQALQAWLTTEGLDFKTIGLLTLVGLPYTFKFIWAPLLDRFHLPWRGARRGSLVLIQLALAATLWALSGLSAASQTGAVALFALALAFLSASQDIVIDAYRGEMLAARTRGLGASMTVLGYRLAMIVSGGFAFIWVDPVQGSGWTWPQVYGVMAAVMAGAAIVSAFGLPRIAQQVQVAAAGGGDVGPVRRVLDALALVTLWEGLRSFWAWPRAWALLLLIVFYKLGDAFAGSLMTSFLLKGMAFPSAEVGVVNKVFGLWLTIGGAIVGGLIMVRAGLWRSLMVFGVLQALSNLGFWWLAKNGVGALGHWTVPAFDWGLVKLAQETPIDLGLLMVIAIENVSGGMGTAAFVALLMGLCRQGYTATQFALLSALASVGRVWVGPLAGSLIQDGMPWTDFFFYSLWVAVPGLVLLVLLRPVVDRLERPAQVGGVDAD